MDPEVRTHPVRIFVVELRVAKRCSTCQILLYSLHMLKIMRSEWPMAVGGSLQACRASMCRYDVLFVHVHWCALAALICRLPR